MQLEVNYFYFGYQSDELAAHFFDQSSKSKVLVIFFCGFLLLRAMDGFLDATSAS